MRSDDLALERVARHVRRVALAQRLREIACQRGLDPRIIGQRRRQQLIVEPDLAVREHDGALGAGEPDTLGAPFGNLFVGRQKLQLTIQPVAFLKVLNESLLGVE